MVKMCWFLFQSLSLFLSVSSTVLTHGQNRTAIYKQVGTRPGGRGDMRPAWIIIDYRLSQK